MIITPDKIAQHAGAKIIDYSLYLNNGTRQFTSTSDFGRNFTYAKFGKGLVFDGVNDLVNISNNKFVNITVNNSDGLTVETWIKLKGINQNDKGVVSKGSGSVGYLWYLLDDAGGGVYQWIVADATDLSSTTKQTTDWVHLAGTYDKSTVRLYINGIQEASTGLTTGLNAFSGDLCIGNYDTCTRAGSYLNGTIDELAIWNISLTADQIRQHYERGVLKLNLSYRTSNDSTTFSDWKAVSNNTLTLTGEFARYFQYRADFNTSDSGISPIINRVLINYSGIFTDRFGNYNFSISTPSVPGSYPLKVNATYETTIVGQQNTSFTVTQPAVIAIGSLWDIRNATTRLAVIDTAGFMSIRGGATQSTEPTADNNDFIVQNSSQGLNLVITNPEGNLLIKGAINENQASPLSPTLNSFIIQNSTGSVVAYVNSTGGLFLTGNLTRFAELD